MGAALLGELTGMGLVVLLATRLTLLAFGPANRNWVLVAAVDGIWTIALSITTAFGGGNGALGLVAGSIILVVDVLRVRARNAHSMGGWSRLWLVGSCIFWVILLLGMIVSNPAQDAILFGWFAAILLPGLFALLGWTARWVFRGFRKA